jgi:hypothetical protein
MDARLIGPALAVLAAAAPAPALAHHSSAIYDREQSVTVEGVVSGYDWSNPHVYIFVDEVLDSGETVTWEVEGSPPALLRRRGWTAQTMKPGDPITLVGRPTRTMERRGMLPTSIQLAGREMLDAAAFREREAAATASLEARAESLEGIWAAESLPYTAGVYPMMDREGLTPAGLEAVEAFDEEAQMTSCADPVAPLSMTFNDIKRIRREGDVVYLAVEDSGVERPVYLNATHDGATPSVHGHSIGEWDGRTLTVDTTHYLPHVMGGAIGVPTTDQKHMVERLTLAEDGGRLTYSFTLEDPPYLAGPVTGQVDWIYRPDLDYAPIPCSVETARRFIREE